MWPDKRTQNTPERGMHDLLVAPGEDGRAESCTVLLLCLLWLPSSAVPQTVPAHTRAANRLCVSAIWGLFAPIPSASCLVLKML